MRFVYSEGVCVLFVVLCGTYYEEKLYRYAEEEKLIGLATRD